MILRFFSTALRDFRQRNGLENLKANDAIYVGFDPTASSLHLGHLVPLLTLMRFYAHGHPVGGATASIGDPSWRTCSKATLDNCTLSQNQSSLTKQLQDLTLKIAHYLLKKRLIDKLQPERIKVLNNFAWHSELQFLEFLLKVGSYMRISTMISRDCVKNRLESEDGLNFKEFSYQLLQAYDYFHLFSNHKCKLQLGASDQWGNILSGIELIGKKTGSEVYGMTFPLIMSKNGTKMGKSSGNAVWLDPTLTSPFEFYQYLMNLSDLEAESLFQLFNFETEKSSLEILSTQQLYPETRPMQKFIARELTTLIHSEQIAAHCESAASILFGKTRIGDNSTGADELDGSEGTDGSGVISFEQKELLRDCMPNVRITVEQIAKMNYLDILSLMFSEFSKNALREFVSSGAISFDKVTIDNPKSTFSIDPTYPKLIIVKLGKRMAKLLEICNQSTL